MSHLAKSKMYLAKSKMSKVGAVMMLLQGIDRKAYRIIEMDNGQSFTQRLQAMGLVKGTKMIILGKKRNGTMLLMVRGFRLALGAGITRCIQVEDCDE